MYISIFLTNVTHIIRDTDFPLFCSKFCRQNLSKPTAKPANKKPVDWFSKRFLVFYLKLGSHTDYFIILTITFFQLFSTIVNSSKV